MVAALIFGVLYIAAGLLAAGLLNASMQYDFRNDLVYSKPDAPLNASSMFAYLMGLTGPIGLVSVLVVLTMETGIPSYTGFRGWTLYPRSTARYRVADLLRKS